MFIIYIFLIIYYYQNYAKKKYILYIFNHIQIIIF